MTPELREKLKAVSVATLATALYKRGLRNQVVQGVGPVAAKEWNIIMQSSDSEIHHSN